MSKDRLLSDEELRDRLYHLTDSCPLNDGHECEYQNLLNESSSSNRVANNKAMEIIIDLINTQKRLYAESVIGEDEVKTYENTHNLNDTENRYLVGRIEGRNQLRAEQRARIK